MCIRDRDFIDNLREELYNEETKKIDTSTEGFNAWIEDIQRDVYKRQSIGSISNIVLIVNSGCRGDILDYFVTVFESVIGTRLFRERCV